MKKSTKKSLWIILFAILLGMIVGSITGANFKLFGKIPTYPIFDLVGKLFLNSLSLIVAPLVMSGIIDGMSQMGREKSFKSVGSKTLLTFFSINLFALAIALVLINVFAPFWAKAAEYLKNALPTHEIPAHTQTGFEQVSQMFLQIIPANIGDAFTKNQLLGLIFFSLLFGYGLTKVTMQNPASTLKNFWSGIFQTMIQMTHVIMKILPLGVFCLVARQFALTGWKSLEPLASLFFSEVTALLLFGLFLIFVLKMVAKVLVLQYLKALSPALLTAFSTASSSATLPITLECLEKRVGVSNAITSFVLPLSTSLNMAASGMYVFLSVAFLAHIGGTPLAFSDQLLLFFLTFIITLGMPGLPSGGIFAILILLKTMSLPVESLALILAIDRILDMTRTTMNVVAGSTSAILVATFEKEKDFLISKK